MTLKAAVGSSHALDSREAGIQAARQALEEIGRAPVVMGWVAAYHTHTLESVIAGVASLLGDTPLFGFSSTGVSVAGGAGRSNFEAAPADSQPRTAAVALLAGNEVHALAAWQAGFVEEGRQCAEKILLSLGLRPSGNTGPLSPDPGIMFPAVEGLNGDAAQLCQALAGTRHPVAGLLAGGELLRGRTFQSGGRQSGSGGLSLALLSGRIASGMGFDHGWKPVGVIARIKRAEGYWVRQLDDERPNELFARLFGRPAREWAFPPLNEMVRLYPLGLIQEGWMQVRTPLRMEADGSLRMHTVLPEGKDTHLLVGEAGQAVEAARKAARQALEALGSARPCLALVWADQAYKSLLQFQPQAALQAASEALGGEIPVLWAYTFGQIARSGQKGPVQFLNGHIQVTVLGEPG